jgi:putative copper export protein
MSEDRRVLAPATDIVRLSLHVTAAAVWVGGQITLAGLVPSLRRSAPETLPVAARQFARLAWPAFAVLVATGIWNVAASHPSQQSGTWNAVLGVKLGVVVLAGVGAFLHQQARTPGARGLWGALGSVGSLTALVLGVALAG